MRETKTMTYRAQNVAMNRTKRRDEVASLFIASVCIWFIIALLAYAVIVAVAIIALFPC